MIIKRKCNLINRKVFAGLICGTMIFAAPQAANAAAQPTLSSNVAVNIGTEALVVDITVPGTLGFAFNADGSNDIPENFIIRNNNKLAYFYLKDIAFDSKSSGWKLAANRESIATNEKTIKLKTGLKQAEKEIVPTNGSKDTTGKATFSKSEFVLAPEVDTKMSFVVERPTYTEKNSQAKAFDMKMVFEMK